MIQFRVLLIGEEELVLSDMTDECVEVRLLLPKDLHKSVAMLFLQRVGMSAEGGQCSISFIGDRRSIQQLGGKITKFGNLISIDISNRRFIVACRR